MSATSFRSVFMVASCACAALGCYMVSLRVASERAALDQVETRIVIAQRDIRLLQTEIGTRGRLAQLERWNVKVLALSAPTADQFLEGGFALARLARPQRQPELEAPVVLASAPAPEPKVPLPRQSVEREPAVSASQLVHQASLKLPTRDALPRTASDQRAPAPRAPAATGSKETDAAPSGSKEQSVIVSSAPRANISQPADARKKSGDNKGLAPPAPVTKPVRMANVDPLAPLPEAAGSSRPAKEPGPTR
ncbi:MAG TPA: hypothetical protein VM346_11045 [Sphingomicrobium sp.]|nr:hypothetical protein [Sphingomicrobium sp.]